MVRWHPAAVPARTSAGTGTTGSGHSPCLRSDPAVTAADRSAAKCVLNSVIHPLQGTTMLLSRVTALITLLLLLSGCTASQQDALLHRVTETGRQQAGLTAATVQAEDVAMSYLERPGDGPVIMLVHGFSANKDTWLRFAAELPADYRIIAPDLAVHADTPAPADGDYTL